MTDEERRDAIHKAQSEARSRAKTLGYLYPTRKFCELTAYGVAASGLDVRVSVCELVDDSPDICVEVLLELFK